MTDSIHVIPFMAYTGTASSDGFGASHMVHGKKQTEKEPVRQPVRKTGTAKRAVPAKSSARSRRVSARTRLVMRRREIALRRFFLLTTTLLILSGALFFGSRTVRAQEPADQTAKYYESITVSCGENIYTILDTYRDSVHYKTVDAYIREVCAINHFDYTEGELIDVRPGDRLIVPYYR